MARLINHMTFFASNNTLFGSRTQYSVIRGAKARRHYLLSVCFLALQDDDILLMPNLQTERSQTILMIPNLQTEDTGVYTCKAKNVYGEVNATFPVKVYGKFTKRVACNLPGMPNIL